MTQVSGKIETRVWFVLTFSGKHCKNIMRCRWLRVKYFEMKLSRLCLHELWITLLLGTIETYLLVCNLGKWFSLDTSGPSYIKPELTALALQNCCEDGMREKMWKYLRQCLAHRRCKSNLLCLLIFYNLSLKKFQSPIRLKKNIIVNLCWCCK